MANQRIVIDSSVAVKWFTVIDETNVEEAFELLAQHRSREIELTAPSHLRLEVLNALWRRQTDETDLLSAARSLDLAELSWHEVDHALARHAISIAATYRLTIYDAVFAALANKLDCELVTADRALAASGACAARLL